MNRLTIGRGLFTLNALAIGVGGLVADLNGTHLYNPRWPPHAKFHDGQTMAVGVLLAVASLFFAWRQSGDRQTNVLATALFAGLLWISQGAANFFPGTAWTDPEFLKPGESLTQAGPQVYGDMVMTALVQLAAWLCWPRADDPHPLPS